MSQITQEKRRFPRKTLEQGAPVFDSDTSHSIGILEDVSQGGFSILTDFRIRPAEARNVTLTLPGPSGTTHRITVMAECVWCQANDNQTRFFAGFSLRCSNHRDEVALNYYIRDYQVTGELQEA